jgi:DNA helicase HerA-like ATPase
MRTSDAGDGPGLRVLGDTEAGPRRAVCLGVEDGRFHTYVIGATGSGKSTLLANLALVDMAAGRGVVVIDPKGDPSHGPARPDPGSRPEATGAREP